MSISVGIIGLPNVGKSTLFKALTKQAVDISNYPFCTIDPNVGVVAVPDERLTAIAKIIKPKKITPTVIEFIDIAGLVRKAHQGEGLGSQFLSHIREVNVICQVVRVFVNEKIAHVEGQPDPQRDIEIINTELIMKDLETINKRLEKARKQAKFYELENLNEIKKTLTQGRLLHPETIPELQLLTTKPIVYVFNVSGTNQEIQNNGLLIDFKLESDMSELSEVEQKELELSSSKLDQLIKACYQALGLITFYTITGGQETRAWTLKNGLKVSQAGGVVHSDFEEKFIRAEVINWQKLVKAKNWSFAREKGILRAKRKEYIVQDGDVIEFKI